MWVMKIFFVQFFCVFLPSLLLLLSPCHCCPLSCPSLHEMFPWCLQFSWFPLGWTGNSEKPAQHCFTNSLSSGTSLGLVLLRNCLLILNLWKMHCSQVKNMLWLQPTYCAFCDWIFLLHKWRKGVSGYLYINIRGAFLVRSFLSVEILLLKKNFFLTTPIGMWGLPRWR